MTKMLCFKNDWIDSTVELLADNSVVERFGSGGEAVKNPQTFASVTAWLTTMEEETNNCCRSLEVDVDEEGNVNWEDEVQWFVPTTYSVGDRSAENDPHDGIIEGSQSRSWPSALEWFTEVLGSK